MVDTIKVTLNKATEVLAACLWNNHLSYCDPRTPELAKVFKKHSHSLTSDAGKLPLPFEPIKQQPLQDAPA